ncbi:hypothetical protein BGZ68_000184 [Mortierella alpina]|nr:hypothetical protein BGZ68_000184 [Mortierella alpina]
MARITIHSIIRIPELTACLSAYLTTSDIAHAMATCKAWSLQFQPFLWSNLRTGELLPKRHTLKQNLHHIRTIDLDQRVTSPFRPPDSNANALELLTALLHGLPTPLTLGSNMAEAGRDCEQTAEATVALCTNLRRIKAVLCSSPAAPEDASWIHLKPLLRSNNNLTHLHIEFSGFTPPPIEEAFSALYRLHHLYIQAPMQEESWFLSLLRASLPLPRLSELYCYFAIASEHYTFKSNSEGGYKGMDDVAEPRGELKAILETAIAARTSRNGSMDFKIKTLGFPHPRNGDIISIALPILRSELVDIETLEVPQLYYYRGGKFYENVARKYCPRLRHLIIPTYYDEDPRHPAAMCSFIRGAVELKTVRGIHFHDTVDSGSNRMISTLITHHSKTLEELELLESSLIFSSDQQAILASCKNLKRFWITPDWGDNVEHAFLFEDVVDQEWGCLGLKELCLTLNRSIDYTSARVAMKRELAVSGEAPAMDEDELEIIRQQLIQQLMNLELNADTEDSVQTDTENDEELEELEELEEALTSEDWYEWPDRTALDRVYELSTVDSCDIYDSGDDVSALAGETFKSDSYEINASLLVDPIDDVYAALEDEGVSDIDMAEMPKKKKKRKKKKKKKDAPAADDDAFEVPVVELEDAEKMYPPYPSAGHKKLTSTSTYAARTSEADDRFRFAIENFRKERTFTPLSAQIISTYFTFGGMDEHPEAPVVRRDGIEIEATVDFVYVVCAFLSSYLLTIGGWHELIYFEMAPKVVTAFLKYILANRVLPEYEDQIRQALEIALKARIEAPRCKGFNTVMPDDFNTACSIRYISAYAYDKPPADSAELLKRLAGIEDASEVQLVDQKMCYVRITRIEQEPEEIDSAPTPALPIASSPDSGSASEGPLGALSAERLKLASESPAEPVLEASQDTTALGSAPASISQTASVLDNQSKAYSRVVVEPLVLDCEDQSDSIGVMEEFSIFVPRSAASLIEAGGILRGSFYTLSNGMVFARPLMALSSFFVEQDEDILELQ